MPKAAITIRRPRAEVEAAWRAELEDVEASFADAPRDQGTEVRVPGTDLETKIRLRRFKQVLETGEVVRSDGTPEGVTKEQVTNQEPAQPPEEVPA